MNKSFFQEILEKINEHQDSSIIEELSYHFRKRPIMSSVVKQLVSGDIKILIPVKMYVD